VRTESRARPNGAVESFVLAQAALGRVHRADKSTPPPYRSISPLFSSSPTSAILTARAQNSARPCDPNPDITLNRRHHVWITADLRAVAAADMALGRYF
jgi:hypothetical protein